MQPSRVTAPLLATLLLAACRTVSVRPGAEAIPIHFEPEDVHGCAYLGEVIGSEGHWYSSWLIANERLTRAALNDLRNKAQASGADTIYVPKLAMLFRTSVTVIGQAYRCKR